MRRPAIRRVAAVLFWAACLTIVLLSVTPQAALPEVRIWDKAQHTIAYLVLGTLGVCAYAPRLLQLGVGLFALGVALELAQLLIPGRFGSFGDVVANGIGVALGIGIAGVGIMLRRSRAVRSGSRS